MHTHAAATLAGVTVATIRTWCRRGAVAAVKQDGKWVIDAASLAHRLRIGNRPAQAGHRITTRHWPATRAGRMPKDHDGKWTVTVDGYRIGKVYSSGLDAELAAAAHRPAPRTAPKAPATTPAPESTVARGWSHASQSRGLHSAVHAAMTGLTGLTPAPGTGCHYCGLNPRTCDCY